MHGVAQWIKNPVPGNVMPDPFEIPLGRLGDSGTLEFLALLVRSRGGLQPYERPLFILGVFRSRQEKLLYVTIPFRPNGAAGWVDCEKIILVKHHIGQG